MSSAGVECSVERGDGESLASTPPLCQLLMPRGLRRGISAINKNQDLCSRRRRYRADNRTNPHEHLKAQQVQRLADASECLQYLELKSLRHFEVQPINWEERAAVDDKDLTSTYPAHSYIALSFGQAHLLALGLFGHSKNQGKWA